MSIINQALKKAQRERLLQETQRPPYRTHQRPLRRSRGRLLVGVGFVTVLAVAAALQIGGQTPTPQAPADSTGQAPTESVRSENAPGPLRLPDVPQPSKVAPTDPVTTDVPVPSTPPLSPGPQTRLVSPVKSATPKATIRPEPEKKQSAGRRIAPALSVTPPAQAAPSARDLFNQAMDIQKNGQRTRALALLRQAIKLDPNLKEAYNSLGNLFYQQRQYRQALPMYQKALTIDPDYAKARNNLGSTYLQLAMDDRAREELHKAIRTDNTYGLAYYNLACVYARAGDSRTAVQYLQQAITIEPQARDWAQSDNDFARVRTAPEMQKLLGPS